MEETANLFNSALLVAAGILIAVVTNVVTKWFESRKEVRELKAKNYFERQAKSIEIVSDRVVDIMLYTHFKLSELGPNEHYVFSLVMEDAENSSLQKKHMELERTIIIESLYLPQKIEKRLNEFSMQLSMAKNYEIHGERDEEIRGMQESSYDGVLKNSQDVLDEIKKYVRKDYFGINK
jgi:hypothetical protein